jgi:hypothetical protein
MKTFDGKIISNCICYRLRVNCSKNCAELVLKGYWNESEEMKYYLEDIKTAADMLSTGFTFIVDLSDFKGCILKYLEMTIEAQKYLVNKGLSVTAEVLPANPLLQSVAESLSQASGMNTVYFNDKLSAMSWISLHINI